jgi:hypothetical protein
LPGQTDDEDVNSEAARRRHWAWSLVACPFLALLAVGLAGSDGGGVKFILLFLVLPGLLSAAAAWKLGVNEREAVGAAVAAAAISGCLWVALILALASAGVLE